MRRTSLPLSLLLVVSCGGTSTRTLRPSDDPAADDPSKPANGGRRLQAVFLESRDGIGVFRHFHDTELDLSCNFVESDGDVWRCLPQGTDAARTSEIIYTDPECSLAHAALYPSAVESSACQAPRYVVSSGNCEEGPRVFELGSEAPSDVRYRLVDGICSASSSGTDYLTGVFALTPVPLERFQSARLHVGKETGGIVPVEVRSDEGARVRLGFRDALEGFDCSLREADGDARCVPIDAGYLGYLFADSGCSRPAAMGQGCAAEHGELRFASDVSSGLVSYHRGGARLTTGYVGSSASCQAAVNDLAFEVGEAVPITRFAAGQRVEVVAGDLTTSVATVGTASLPEATLRSRVHGAHECHFASGSDGELRCMPPPERYLTELFADAACSQRVESTQAEVLAVAVPAVCPPQVRVYARGDRHEGAVFAIHDGGGCELAFERPPNDSGRSPHYAFPTEISPDEFAPMFQVVR